MCGIVGAFQRQAEGPRPVTPDTAQAMLQTLWRRGPDDSGQWWSEDGRCWLGHRRLAIIDLHSGQQPLCNENGSIWVSYNGEIYNYQVLRQELRGLGHVFKTQSDTEVLVHGYEAWGIVGLARRLQGIFAFAIFDAGARALFLVRDPMGVKPLYWWCDGRVLLFASEIKALLPHPALRNRRVNRAGVAQIVVTRYVSRPETMFEGVFRLPEGCLLKVDMETTNRLVPQRYWDIRFQPRDLDLDDAVEELDGLLKRTVDMQLMADVPLGVQLSGGVDSSMMVALMETLRRERGTTEPVKTFSVGFDIPQFSELGYARQVAKRYGTDHRETLVGFKDFAEELPFLAWLYDEPMGEPSAIPAYLMCKAAKPHVSVMLCGEGADELFGGYSKYVFEQFAPYLDWLPASARQGLLHGGATLIPFKGRRLRSMAEILGISSQAGRFASWYGGFDLLGQRGLFSADFAREVGDGGLQKVFETFIAAADTPDALARFLYTDSHSRLVDDILVKGDRMSMGASVEARVPFLDHKMVEFAAGLPGRLKVNGPHSKIVLKKLAERYLPNEAIHRRKVGFTVPLTRWFVGPWRRLITDVLLSDRCLGRGYFRPDTVRRIVQDHIQQKVDREQGIWLMLALEIWHRLFVDDDGSEAAAWLLRDELLSCLTLPG